MAPFSLATYADTHAIDGPSGKAIWTFMLDALTRKVMPLPPVTISAADRQVLLDWLSAGAPAAGPSDSCTAPGMADGGIDGAASDGGRGADSVDPPDASALDSGGWECGAEVGAHDSSYADDAAPEAPGLDGSNGVDVEPGDDGAAE